MTSAEAGKRQVPKYLLLMTCTVKILVFYFVVFCFVLFNYRITFLCQNRAGPMPLCRMLCLPLEIQPASASQRGIMASLWRQCLSWVASRDASDPMVIPSFSITPRDEKVQRSPPEAASLKPPVLRSCLHRQAQGRHGKSDGREKSTGIFQIILNLCVKSVTWEQSDLGSLQLNPPLILLSKAGLQYSKLRDVSSWMRASRRGLMCFTFPALTLHCAALLWASPEPWDQLSMPPHCLIFQVNGTTARTWHHPDQCVKFHHQRKSSAASYSNGLECIYFAVIAEHQYSAQVFSQT